MTSSQRPDLPTVPPAQLRETQRRWKARQARSKHIAVVAVGGIFTTALGSWLIYVLLAN